MWKLTLPDGTILTFADWDSARIEAVQQGYRLGVVLIPVRCDPPQDPA